MSDVRKYNLMDLQFIVNKYLNYSEYLQLIKFMFKECELIEVTEYSKQSGISDKTIRNRINNGKIPILILGKTTFIIKKLV